jgi:cytochrome c peroxidase
MKIRITRTLLTMAIVPGLAFTSMQAAASQESIVFQPGHPSLKQFLLPDRPEAPKNNELTPERIALGKKLFFDPRLSNKGNMSCATCHNPSLGWSDGLPTGRGHDGVKLDRATPTIINTAFNSIQMWDGREKSLESQATGPMKASVEMASDFDRVFAFLNSNPEYVAAFEKAYPGEPINPDTLSKAIASYERTIVSNNSPFDRWVKGDRNAMTAAQVRGMEAFMDPARGNCAACHSDANFTDNGFHNLGLASAKGEAADPGRYKIKPIRVLKGAFKTPTLRDIELTAPYFHDGSARTLEDVVRH